MRVSRKTKMLSKWIDSDVPTSTNSGNENDF